MLNKSKKLLSTLLLGLIITGCDVNALPKDYDSTYGAIDMEDVYDTVRNNQGEAAIYNQLIEKIAENEIKKAKRWDELCSRVQEKIDDMIENNYTDVIWDKYDKNVDESVYLDYDDEKLLNYYRAEGYTIGDLADKTIKHDSDYWNASKVLAENSKIVNTYISDTLKSEVLLSMLNEQYIHDNKANSLYKTKQLRQLEYVYVDFDSKYDSYDTITEFDAKLQSGEYDLLDIENKWKEHKKDVIDQNAQYVGTEKDKDGKYYTEFSSCGGSVEQCAKEKMRAIDKTEYYSEPKIYTNSDSPLLASMTDTLFSSNLEVELKEIKDGKSTETDNILPVKDGDKTYYYLKSQSDVELGARSLINVDTSTNNYYFVRFVVVDKINPTEEGAPEYNADLVRPYDETQKVEYAIAETLAKTASNYSNSIIYYLELYNFEAHDDKFYQYIFDTYGYPEEE